MHGMAEVTLVRGSEEMLEDPESNVVACRLVDFTMTEFSIRQNVRGYSLPSRWAYMLHEYGACSGAFRLPVAGCTMIVEVPIDWGTVEALPAPSFVAVGDCDDGDDRGAVGDDAVNVRQ